MIIIFNLITNRSPLKDAGNNCHFPSDVANFYGGSADPADDGNHLLLQKPFLLGTGCSRKTQSYQMVQIGIWV